MTDRDTEAMRETSARSRSSAARPRNTSATAPAITATTNATAIPATNARRRRADLTSSRRLASMKSRSSVDRSGSDASQSTAVASRGPR